MEKIADLLTKFMISESSSENLDYEVCKFGLLMALKWRLTLLLRYVYRSCLECLDMEFCF